MEHRYSRSKPWRIENAAGELQVYLYDEIGGFSDTGITARSFVDDLKKAGPVQRIHLHVNSPGGSVFDGISIYNALLNSGSKVTAQVDGLAASIASVIIMAAEKITMSENSMLMIHNPNTSIYSGESGDFRKMAETLDKVRGSIIGAYQRHSPLSAKEIGQMMDDETWLTAQEAVDKGFAEEIAGEGEVPIAANVLSKFRRVPQQIAARVQRSETPSPVYTHWDSASLEELQAEHERLLLQRRLQDARYRQ